MSLLRNLTLVPLLIASLGACAVEEQGQFDDEHSDSLYKTTIHIQNSGLSLQDDGSAHTALDAVSGEVMVSSTSLMVERTLDELLADDGDEPLPELPPQFYIDTPYVSLRPTQQSQSICISAHSFFEARETKYRMLLFVADSEGWTPNEESVFDLSRFSQIVDTETIAVPYANGQQPGLMFFERINLGPNSVEVVYRHPQVNQGEETKATIPYPQESDNYDFYIAPIPWSDDAGLANAEGEPKFHTFQFTNCQ